MHTAQTEGCHGCYTESHHVQKAGNPLCCQVATRLAVLAVAAMLAVAAVVAVLAFVERQCACSSVARVAAAPSTRRLVPSDWPSAYSRGHQLSGGWTISAQHAESEDSVASK